MRAAKFVVTCTGANVNTCGDRARPTGPPRVPRAERRLRQAARRSPAGGATGPTQVAHHQRRASGAKKGFDVLLRRDRAAPSTGASTSSWCIAGESGDREASDPPTGRTARSRRRRRVTRAAQPSRTVRGIPALQRVSPSPAESPTTATATAFPTCWSRRWPRGCRSSRPRCPASPS